MAGITTRSGKGSPLTNQEMDDNLDNLNNDKVETSVLVDWKEPTGWIDNDSITMNYDNGTRTVSLNGDLRYFWRGEVKTLGDGVDYTSPAHSAGNATYFLYSTDGDTFAWSSSVWEYSDVQVALVVVNTGYNYCLREIHGLMPGIVHTELHDLLGTYRKTGLGPTTATYTLNTASDPATTPGFDAGTIADEDVTTNIAATTEGNYTLMKIGASSVPTFYTSQAYPFRSGGSYIYYNNVTTGADVVSSTGVFLNVYEMLIPATSDANSQTYRRILVQPQAQYASLALARAESTASLSLGNFASPEHIIYTRLTYSTSAGNGNVGKVQLAAIDFITGSRISQASSSASTAPTAANIPFTPYSTIASTNVQNAIQELLDESAGGGTATFEQLDSAGDVGTGADQVAQGDHLHDGQTITPDSVQLDTAAGVSVSEGEIAWNDTDKTFDLGLANGVVLQAGQEIHYQVKNTSGSLIPDGSVVMATGTTEASGVINIGLMDGTDPANAKYLLGITTQDIADTELGKVTSFGKVRNLDTSSFLDGDVLWVSSTTPGVLTKTEPTPPAIGMPIAFVINSHLTLGTIFVRVTAQDEHAHEAYGAVATHESTYNHDNFADTTDVTYEQLSTNGDIGTGADQVAQGDHTHDNRYYTESEVDSALNSKIEASDITYENLSANGDVGTGADQVALGSHTHDALYEGKIELLTNDPVSPSVGEKWVNTTSYQLKVKTTNGTIIYEAYQFIPD